MMKPKFIIIVLLITIIGIYAYSKNQTDSPGNQEATTIEPSPSNSSNVLDANPRPMANTYSSEDVASHNDTNDCWMIINDAVYDVTAWIPDHPGGKVIALGCGKDASVFYNARGTKKEPHSKEADAMREKYYIGDLAN